MNEQSAPEASAAPPHAPRTSATLAYTAARLALFAVVLGVLWLVRVRGPLLVILALAVSGLASFVLLRGRRVAMAGEVQRRVATIRTRSAERTAREDAAADAILAEEERQATGPSYSRYRDESGV